MILVISPVLAIIIVFLSVIAFFALFILILELTKKFIDKKGSKEMDKDMLKAKIYQLLYEGNSLTLQALSHYFEIDEESMQVLLKELIDDNKIKEEDNAYKVIK